VSTSPTQLTLKKWRKAGYLCAVVEKWNMHAKIRQDLFGCIDVIAIGPGETVGIQCTSYSNVSARVKKFASMPETVAALRDGNWRLMLEGWHKPKHRLISREVDCS